MVESMHVPFQHEDGRPRGVRSVRVGDRLKVKGVWPVPSGWAEVKELLPGSNSVKVEFKEGQSGWVINTRQSAAKFVDFRPQAGEKETDMDPFRNNNEDSSAKLTGAYRVTTVLKDEDGNAVEVIEQIVFAKRGDAAKQQELVRLVKAEKIAEGTRYTMDVVQIG